jgi:hypothetical protein
MYLSKHNISNLTHKQVRFGCLFTRKQGLGYSPGADYSQAGSIYPTTPHKMCTRLSAYFDNKEVGPMHSQSKLQTNTRGNGEGHMSRGQHAPICIWCIWCGYFTPHEPPQAAPLLNTKGLPSGLDRTRGVVEHFRAPVQEEQPQRTPTDGGPHGGLPLTSKPRRRRVSHLSQAGYKQWTGLGADV